MRLALFDLDNTLLAGDSDYLWGRFLVDRGIVDADYYARENQRFHADYQAGRLDIHAFQRFVIQPLIEQPEDKMLALRERYIDECIRPVIAPATPDLIRRHRENGDVLLIITATNRFITEPIAPLLGVPDLLATDPERVDGHYTGAIAGTPCYREGKLKRLDDWLATRRSFDEIVAYSDSHNDIALLERADRPAAVDPDAELEAFARQRGWPVVSLREQSADEVFALVA